MVGPDGSVQCDRDRTGLPLKKIWMVMCVCEADTKIKTVELPQRERELLKVIISVEIDVSETTRYAKMKSNTARGIFLSCKCGRGVFFPVIVTLVIFWGLQSVCHCQKNTVC